MEKQKIALISGGISSEREVSLNSGNQVYEALDKDRYVITRYDPKTDISRLVADAPDIDAALIILHGPYGEDGTIQGLLDLLDVPYQGSGVLGSAVAMNKLISKRLYEKSGLLVPPYLSFTRSETPDQNECIRKIGLPLVIKPVSAGSSVGMSIVRSEDKLSEAIALGFSQDTEIIAEAYIEGTELTAGILGNEDLTALPLIEIIPGEEYEFFDYEAKYKAGATKEICPARVDEKITSKAQEDAKIAHKALGLLGYSRTDMILKDEKLYILETNTIPGMTGTSLFPQAADKAGIGFTQLLDRLIELGIKYHEKKKSSGSS